jgi:hypothetical protein
MAKHVFCVHLAIRVSIFGSVYLSWPLTCVLYPSCNKGQYFWESVFNVALSEVGNEVFINFRAIMGGY